MFQVLFTVTPNAWIDACRDTAPNNFTRNDDGGYSYVYKQPTTIEELLACTEALEACGVVAVGNDGGPVDEHFTPNDLILFYELQNSPTPQSFFRYVERGGDLDTAFRLAVQYSSIETLNQLLDMGANINSQSPADGTTPLMYAVSRGNLEIIEFLIGRKADVHICNFNGDNVIDSFRYWENCLSIKKVLLEAGALSKKVKA
jgi:hypothetical protein